MFWLVKPRGAVTTVVSAGALLAGFVGSLGVPALCLRCQSFGSKPCVVFCAPVFVVI